MGQSRRINPVPIYLVYGTKMFDMIVRSQLLPKLHVKPGNRADD